jgi:hypothetical protein
MLVAPGGGGRDVIGLPGRLDPRAAWPRQPAEGGNSGFEKAVRQITLMATLSWLTRNWFACATARSSLLPLPIRTWCRLDHALVSGVLEGLHAESAADAVLVPPPGACCVELRPR